MQDSGRLLSLSARVGGGGDVSRTATRRAGLRDIGGATSQNVKAAVAALAECHRHPRLAALREARVASGIARPASAWPATPSARRAPGDVGAHRRGSLGDDGARADERRAPGARASSRLYRTGRRSTSPSGAASRARGSCSSRP